MTTVEVSGEDDIIVVDVVADDAPDVIEVITGAPGPPGPPGTGGGGGTDEVFIGSTDPGAGIELWFDTDAEPSGGGGTTGFLVLGPDDPIDPATPPGTLIFRLV